MSESKRLTPAFRDDMELHFNNASKAGANMLEFAIRSLSNMAFRNPIVQVPGLIPYLGTSLDLSWVFIISLCVGKFVAQFSLSILIFVSYVEPSEMDTAGQAGV